MTVAIVAGSFDPPTLGHEQLVRQAARLFDHVRVLVADNPGKQATFDRTERVAMLRELFARMPHVSVDEHRGYVFEYARRIGATFLVRGIRSSTDTDAELELAAENRAQAPEIATVFLPTLPELAHVSSTEVRERARGQAKIRDLVSEPIAQRVRQRYAGR